MVSHRVGSTTTKGRPSKGRQLPKASPKPSKANPVTFQCSRNVLFDQMCSAPSQLAIAPLLKCIMVSPLRHWTVYDGLWQRNTQPWKWKNNKPWTLSIWWNKLPCELWLAVERHFKLVFTVSRWNPGSWASWTWSMLGKEHRSATPQLFASSWRVSLCTQTWDSQSCFSFSSTRIMRMLKASLGKSSNIDGISVLLCILCWIHFLIWLELLSWGTLLGSFDSCCFKNSVSSQAVFWVELLWGGKHQFSELLNFD